MTTRWQILCTTSNSRWTASPPLISLFLKQGLRLIAGGLILGLVASYTAIRYFESLLFGFTSANAGSYVKVALALLLAGGVACWIPARRASMVEPIDALRCE